jgi:putative redox protein
MTVGGREPKAKGRWKMLEGRLHLTTVEGAGRQFVAQSGTGHSFVMDDADGHSGPKPIEFALLALGGCTAFDVISILRKMRQHVTAYDVELHAEQCENSPRVFTRVEIKHRLHGQIDPEAVRKAIHLSESKYCSVGAMIGKTAVIEASFEIVPDSVPVPVEHTAEAA